MERNIKAYISIALGILLLFTGINMLGKKKKIPSVIYHIWLVTILLVCTISCIGHFNFHGVFFFLHLVNPFVFLVYYKEKSGLRTV